MGRSEHVDIQVRASGGSFFRCESAALILLRKLCFFTCKGAEALFFISGGTLVPCSNVLSRRGI